MLYEEALIFPAPRYPEGDWSPAEFAYEDVYFSAADGTQLHGWYLPHPAPRAEVLFCHGNGEHVAYVGPYLAALRELLRVSLFGFDYRGYGRSQGRPSETGVYQDGGAAQRWLAERAGLTVSDVVLLGRSIGGAVAVELAARHGGRALILECTFTSITDVAAHMFPWLPTSLLLRSRFDSLSKIANYHGPLLQCHGTRDNLIPFHLGERLFAAAPSPRKRFLPVPDADHNDPPHAEYYHALEEFIAQLPPLRSPTAAGELPAPAPAAERPPAARGDV